MENFTQKWTIVALLEDIGEGSEFYFTDFPVHVTIADVFKINHNGYWLTNELAKVLSGQKTFSITASVKGMLGPNSDVPVMKIMKTSQLMNLYDNIHDWLLKSGATYNEPQYQGAGYLPHNTLQKSGLIKEGETRQIKSVSIIDLFPNGDGYRRKVFKTVKLE